MDLRNQGSTERRKDGVGTKKNRKVCCILRSFCIFAKSSNYGEKYGVTE